MTKNGVNTPPVYDVSDEEIAGGLVENASSIIS
jgi:hypothetical protein